MNQGAFTPRQRQEIEPQRLLQTRRPIPIAVLTASFATILTARTDADFLIEQLWVACTTADTYSLCLVPSGGTAGATNAIATAVVAAANTTAIVIGAQGLLVPPGYTLQAKAATVDRINIFGWGFDIIGDSQ